MRFIITSSLITHISITQRDKQGNYIWITSHFSLTPLKTCNANLSEYIQGVQWSKDPIAWIP